MIDSRFHETTYSETAHVKNIRKTLSVLENALPLQL